MLGAKEEIEVKNFDFAIAVFQDLQRSLEEELIAMFFAIPLKNKSMEHPMNIKVASEPVLVDIPLEVNVDSRIENERMFDSLIELQRPVELAKYLKI